MKVSTSAPVFPALLLAAALSSSCGCGDGPSNLPPPDVAQDTGHDWILDTAVDDVDEEEGLEEALHIHPIDFQVIGSHILLFMSVTNEAGDPVTDLNTNVESIEDCDFVVLEDDVPLSASHSLDVQKWSSDVVWRTLVLFDTSYAFLTTHALPDVVEPVRGFAEGVTALDTQARKVSGFKPVSRTTS